MFDVVDSFLYEMGLRVSSHRVCPVVLISCSTLAFGYALVCTNCASSKFLLDSNGPPLTSLGTLLEEKLLFKNKRLMKTCSFIVVSALFMIFSHLAGANQADDTTITITGQTLGVYALYQ